MDVSLIKSLRSKLFLIIFIYMADPLSIRCPSEKHHGKYNTCGALLGAISEGELFFHCGRCNVLWSVVQKDGGLEFKQMKKSDRLKLKDQLKSVE